MSVSIDTTQVIRAFKKAPMQTRRQMRDSFDHIKRSFLKRFRDERLKGRPGVKGKSRGLFIRFKSYQHTDGRNLKLVIFTRSKAAQIHETGGTVRGAGKKLAIPLSSAKTGTGRLKKEYKRKKGQTLSSHNKLVPLEIKGKNFLGRVKGRGKNKHVEPVFILKNRIRIRPRLGFYDTWGKQKNRTIQIVNKGLNKVVRSL